MINSDGGYESFNQSDVSWVEAENCSEENFRKYYRDSHYKPALTWYRQAKEQHNRQVNSSAISATVASEKEKRTGVNSPII